MQSVRSRKLYIFLFATWFHIFWRFVIFNLTELNKWSNDSEKKSLKIQSIANPKSAYVDDKNFIIALDCKSL